MWVLRADEDEGGACGFVFRLRPGSLKTMGRAVRADFVVDAALVSRLHCRFSVDEVGTLTVEDLESTNGTSVNGRAVTRAVLVPGDRVRVGRVEFLVTRDADEPARLN
jgi:pSer/pThr/pTyr-binding forkhead associated (FHA) protein